MAIMLMIVHVVGALITLLCNLIKCSLILLRAPILAYSSFIVKVLVGQSTFTPLFLFYVKLVFRAYINGACGNSRGFVDL